LVQTKSTQIGLLTLAKCKEQAAKVPIFCRKSCKMSDAEGAGSFTALKHKLQTLVNMFAKWKQLGKCLYRLADPIPVA
jgi:hypothetical protein